MKRLWIPLVVLLGVGMSASLAHADKCSKAVDKTTSVALISLADMARTLGEQGKQALADASLELKKARPHAIQQCRQAVKNERRLYRTLDCILAARDVNAMSQCKGIERLSADECTRAINKATRMATEAVVHASVVVDDSSKSLLAQARASMELARPGAIAQCRTLLPKDAQLAGTLACIVAAKDLDSMSRCPGSERLMIGDKCTLAVEKAMNMAMRMVEGMAKAGGDEGKKMLVEAKKKMEQEKPVAINKCRATVAQKPDAAKALDCIIAAKDIMAMQSCEGADDLMK